MVWFGRRGALTLTLFTLGIQAAAAELPPCEKAVRFSAAWFADPEIDTSKSSTEVTSIGSGADTKGTQLGHVVVETKLAVAPQPMCRGLLVTLAYAKPMLRVAKELPPGSCAYARVMNHEQTHVRIHRDIARQFRELNYPWGRGTNTESVLIYAKQELDRLMQAQVRFDSPEEYGRNSTACNGEIMRLVKPAAL